MQQQQQHQAHLQHLVQNSSVVIDLSVKGRAICGNISSEYAVVASSNGALSFFQLNGSSIPKHILHFENPVSICKVKCSPYSGGQTGGGGVDNSHVLATLRSDGTLSLWQPFSSSLRPLLAVINSNHSHFPTASTTQSSQSVTSSFITDMEFSNLNSNIIAAGCGSGLVQVYDTRAPFALQRSLTVSTSSSGGKSSGSSSLPTGPCRSLSFSSANPYLIASCQSNRILLWDLRASHQQQLLIEAPQGVLFGDVAWCGGAGSGVYTQDDSPTGGCAAASSLVTVSRDGAALHWWSSLSGALEGKRELVQHQQAQTLPPLEETDNAYPLTTPPLLLPTLSGRGVVLSQMSLITGSGTSQTNLTTAPSLQSSSQPVAGRKHATSTSLEKQRVVEDVSEQAPARRAPCLSIYGYPRATYSLSSLYVPPSASASLPGNLPIESGPSSQLSHLTSSFASGDSLCLSLKWGPPNRLVPQASLQGGLELLALSASASSCSLHALALSHETVHKYSEDGVGGGGGESQHSRLSLRARGGVYRREGASKSSDLATAGNSSGSNSKQNSSVQSANAVVAPTSSALRVNANPPKYSIGGLHRGWVTPSNIVTKESLSSSSKERHKDPSTSAAKQVRLGFWGQLQHEVLVLEEALQKGHLSGLALGRIDQYARQITLEVTRTRPSLFAFEEAGRTSSTSSDHLTTPLTSMLIISFPQNFPSTELLPTFTVRSLYDSSTSTSKSSSDKENIQEVQTSALETELASVARAALLHSDKYVSSLSTSDSFSSGFLLDVGRCFWNRVLQIWSEIAAVERKQIMDDEDNDDDDVNNNSLPNYKELTATEGGDGVTNQQLGLESFVDEELEAENMGIANRDRGSLSGGASNKNNVIDPRAYRVCNPVCSGGIFSCTGSLSLFGGSAIHLLPLWRKSGEVSNTTLSAPTATTATSMTTCDTQLVETTAEDREVEAPLLSPSNIVKVSSKITKKKSAAARDSFSFYHQPHKAYARDHGDQHETVAYSKSSAAGASLSSRPKSYADLLLHQREVRAAYNAPTPRRNGSISKRGRSRSKEGIRIHRVFEGEEDFDDNGRTRWMNALGSGERVDEGVDNKRSGSYLEHFFVDSGKHDVIDNEDSISDNSSNVDTEDNIPKSVSSESMRSDEDSESVETSESGESKQKHNARSDGGGTTTLMTTSSSVSSHNYFNSSLDELGEKLDRSQDNFGNSNERDVDVAGYNSSDIRTGNKLVYKTFTSTKPAQITVCMYICGEKRFKLAREYTFKAFTPFEKHNSPIVSTTHQKNMHHSNSDPNVKQQQKHIQRDGGSSTSSSVGMGKRVGSMNNLVLSIDYEYQHDHPIRKQRSSFNEKYVSAEAPSKLSSYFSEERKELDRDEYPHVSFDANSIAEACLTNSELAKKHKDSQLTHIWHMLSISLKIMSITKYVLLPSSQSSTGSLSSSENTNDELESRNYVKKKLDSCRVMVTCGLSKDWTVHSLGRPLFRRVYSHLRSIGDLQTLATLICTVGGSMVMALMLGDSSMYTNSSLDKILLRYADVLHRWECHVHATEISKFVSFHVFDLAPEVKTSEQEKIDAASYNIIPTSGDFSAPLVSNSTRSIFSFNINCNSCGNEIDDNFWCRGCTSHALRCSICDKTLRGVGFFCPRCGHGGHGHHIKEWFRSSQDCPTGCGCHCADYSFNSFPDKEQSAFKKSNTFYDEEASSFSISFAHSGDDSLEKQQTTGSSSLLNLDTAGRNVTFLSSDHETAYDDSDSNSEDQSDDDDSNGRDDGDY